MLENKHVEAMLPRAGDSLFMLFTHLDIPRAMKKTLSDQINRNVENLRYNRANPGLRPRDLDEAVPAIEERISKINEQLETLDPKLGFLDEILCSVKNWKGCAFVWFDFYYVEYIRARDRGLGSGNLALQEARLKIRVFNNLLRELFEARYPRLRLLTVNNLDLLLRMNLGQHFSLSQFLIGGATITEGSTSYDTPKVIESIIRIINIGRNAPIFRFDDDVIFYGFDSPNKEGIRDEQCASIRLLCNHFSKLRTDHNINYFMYSGCYKSGGDREYLDKYSVRVMFMAQRNDATIVDVPKNSSEEEIKKDLEKKIVSEENINTNVENFIKDLWIVGANPNLQIISGAGLCMSASAILDLPPFSNMRKSIMWIDDHLKYSLHHSLKHFGYVQNSLQKARLEDAKFFQERYKDGINPMNLENVRWHLSTYFPRLLFGCIADKWLRGSPLLKRKVSALGTEEEFPHVLDVIENHDQMGQLQIYLAKWTEMYNKEDERDKLSEDIFKKLIDTCLFNQPYTRGFMNWRRGFVRTLGRELDHLCQVDLENHNLVESLSTIEEKIDRYVDNRDSLVEIIQRFVQRVDSNVLKQALRSSFDKVNLREYLGWEGEPVEEGTDTEEGRTGLMDIRESMQGLAWERLEEFQQLFSKTRYDGTYLQLVVMGKKARGVPEPAFKLYQHLEFFPKICPEGLALAIEEKSPKLGEDIDKLIDDFLNYPAFVYAWRHFKDEIRRRLNWSVSFESNYKDWFPPSDLDCG